MKSETTPTTPELVCLGEPLLEFNQQPDLRYLAGYGGDTSNTAIAAARSQTRTGYISRLGADPFGDRFIELWNREDVDCQHVYRDQNASTGIYFVTHGPDGHEFSYYRANSAASRLDPADVPTDYVAGARVLHVSAISQAISDSARRCVKQAIEAAKNAGTFVSYDTNLRLNLWSIEQARETINETIANAEILLPGLDDAVLLTGTRDPDSIVDQFLAQGTSLVALTLGSEGVLIATGDQRLRLNALNVSPVDATGAGDTFDGAFVSEWLRTGDPVQAGRYANVAAALSTTGFGAVAPIPTRQQVEARLAEIRI